MKIVTRDGARLVSVLGFWSQFESFSHVRSKEKFVQPFFAPEPSPAAVAAAVAKSAKHRSLDARIAELTAERETVIAEMRELIASNRKEENDKAIRRLHKKRESLEVTLSQLRQEVRAHRDGHSKSVREALKPQCVDSAKAMIEGLNAFVAAVQKFNACQDEIDRFGGEPQRVYIAANIGATNTLRGAFWRAIDERWSGQRICRHLGRGQP